MTQQRYKKLHKSATFLRIFYAVDYFFPFWGNIVCLTWGDNELKKLVAIMKKKYLCIMKKIIFCTKENPLHKQISKEKSLLIEELEVKGYLDNNEDYELLTEMSGERGCLKRLDLSNVTESFPGHDYWGCFYIDDGDLAIYPDSFVNSIRLEEIVFPDNLKGIGYNSFINCENLIIDELPETLKSIGGGAFQNCPKLKNVFVPNELYRHGSGFCFGGQFPESEFSGSVENFLCERTKWPLDEKGNDVYSDDAYSSMNYFVIDGVLFWESDCCEGFLNLLKYPAMNRRTTYEVPRESTAAFYKSIDWAPSPLEIKAHAFERCKYLKTLILQNCIMEPCAICDCPALETIIFKGWACGNTISSFDICWNNIIIKCPNLKDIYLYAEDPRAVPYEIFSNLENIGDIVIHVPCFCADKYRSHGVEYIKQKPFLNRISPEPESENDTLYVKEWCRFKRIDEFDPIDFIENEI